MEINKKAAENKAKKYILDPHSMDKVN
jgi:hypothetical protein